MIGNTISHYKIIEKLGEGGMGVVYKAQDIKLDRLVALKFLPEHVSVGSADLERFTQEAKAAAGLNHPNICTIHGIEEADQKNFIVMEFVDGQTLQEKKFSLSMKQALDVGIQIAEGLAAAHEKGIVHRDIKPENIMIRKDGRVQVMDFGLAKLRGASRLTKEGSTVGTAGYMSPEQVQGLETDHRSDIFSLGVILYEMFAGQSPFKGMHETAISYEIVNVDPQPITSVRPDVTPEINRVVFECLQKDPEERFQSVKDVSRELKRFKRESSRQHRSRIMSAQSGIRREGQEHFLLNRLPWIVAALCFLTSLVMGLIYFLSPSASKHVLHAFLLPPEKAYFLFYGNEAGPPAISPNGKMLSFVAVDSTGRRSLYLRRLDMNTTSRLAGTNGALHPFWSPDSRFIGFFARGKLLKVDAVGGPPVVIADCANSRGGAWSPNGQIAFAPDPAYALFRVSSDGGTPTPLTKFDASRKENSHRWPWFLPDGIHFLYFARTVATGTKNEAGAIRLASIDGKTNRILVHTSSNAAFASGHLLYARGRNLVAQKFNERSLELEGEAVAIADDVVLDESILRTLFTCSQNGVLLYQKGSVKLGSRLGIFDRDGKLLSVGTDLPEYLNPSFSPNTQRAATSIYDQASRNIDIWIYTIARHSKTRLTFDETFEQFPIWSPDGNRIVFAANPKGIYDLYQKPASGAGNEELILATDQDKRPRDISPDGGLLLYEQVGGPTAQNDLWILPLSGEREPTPFLNSEFDESEGKFSDDGRWIAYTSNESGQSEVYVRPYPAPTGRWQVSIAGGKSPRWSRKGKELFYVTSDYKLMSAEVSAVGATLEITNVHSLFDVPYLVQLNEANYDVSPDGNRFLINARLESQNQTPLNIIMNWDELVQTKRR